ncbi:MAG: hypothetical protein GF331_09305 [Chitinivibrionales bacterium]|nr:hypothetical protein [Chitinivibrionales bacterium]
MVGRPMRRKNVFPLASAVLCAVWFSRVAAVVDSGMVLFQVGGAQESLELYYLSTGKRVTLVDGWVRFAKFSPDGTRIALVKDTPTRIKRGHTMNLDGSNLRELGFSTNDIHWRSNGYIYWTNQGIKRIPENGGQIEHVYVFNRDSVIYSAVPGVGVANAMADISLSADGTRAAGTAGLVTNGSPGGYGMLVWDLANQEAFNPAVPCQGGISASGNRLHVGNPGHRVYRVFAYGQDYEEFGDGDTYHACGPGRKCPTDIGVIDFSEYLKDRFNTDNLGDIDCRTPRWVQCDEDIVISGVVEGDSPLPDEAFGSYIVEFAPGDWTACEFTQVSSEERIIQDYFCTEIELSDGPFSLTPLSITFSIEEGTTDLPASRISTLTASGTFTGTPSVAGQPSWLSVTVSQVTSAKCELENALTGSSLPGEGLDSATIIVTPQPGASPLTYKVYLDVGPAPLPSISCLSPTEGQELWTGDTLRVRYTTNDDDLLGVVVYLSMDEGETFLKLNSDEAAPTGTDMVLEYVLPHSLFPAGSSQDHNDRCYLMLTDYPTGHESYSPTFTIRKSAVSGTGRTLRSPGLQRPAFVVRTVRGIPHVSTSFASHVTMRLFDIYGRVVREISVPEGERSFALTGITCGNYVLRARYPDGSTETLALAVYGNSSR